MLEFIGYALLGSALVIIGAYAYLLWSQFKTRLHMGFVCKQCMADKHGECKGLTWCDCQHKTPAPQVPSE